MQQADHGDWLDALAGTPASAGAQDPTLQLCHALGLELRRQPAPPADELALRRLLSRLDNDVWAAPRRRGFQPRNLAAAAMLLLTLSLGVQLLPLQQAELADVASTADTAAPDLAQPGAPPAAAEAPRSAAEGVAQQQRQEFQRQAEQRRARDHAAQDRQAEAAAAASADRKAAAEALEAAPAQQPSQRAGARSSQPMARLQAAPELLLRGTQAPEQAIAAMAQRLGDVAELELEPRPERARLRVSWTSQAARQALVGALPAAVAQQLPQGSAGEVSLWFQRDPHGDD